ncbi:MAG: 3-isopropylmalate dehydratase large subunit [Oscillospiraceae bacterium]|nr:3-isopropylmalate dehydratase large subunit [Oscillospiraceae bacterium]
MTITEKILAAHSGRDHVVPGELVTARLDGVLANDVTTHIAVKEFRAMGFDKVFDKERVYLVNDHFAPNANINAATASKVARDFACECSVRHFYDVGRMGIEHALLPEQGLVLPGEAVVGGDSHTCTYGALGAFSTGMGSTDIAVAMGTGELWFKVPKTRKFIFNGSCPRYVTGKDLMLYTLGKISVSGALYMSMEFAGQAISEMDMDGRFTMCNMAIEAGAKNGIIEPDEMTLAYVREHNRLNRPFTLYRSDPDAVYERVDEWDVSSLEPVVACPHLPDNTRFVSEVGDVPVHQVVIGSCTNGRISDLRAAAEILKGQQVDRNVRCIIIPATGEIYRQAMHEGLMDIFLDAGAAISTPTCGPCFGGHMGILANGETAVSTTNRNFVGRMGHPGSSVYLASPYVAAAAAVAGRIIHPGEVK